MVLKKLAAERVKGEISKSTYATKATAFRLLIFTPSDLD